MLDLSMKGLAIGGIVTAVIAGWQSVKGWFAQLSALVIIKAEMDYHITHQVKNHLKLYWNVIPSGIFNFKGTWISHRDTELRMTPFRMLNKTTVFYKDRQFLIYKLNERGVMYSIRGLVDFQKLIQEAILAGKERATLSTSELSRYEVMEIRGTAGESFFEKRGDTEPGPGGYSGNRATIDTADDEIIIGIDKSFMYPESDYIRTITDDPLKGLFYSSEMLKYLKEAKTWLDNRQWYVERNIPWRRGWALQGPGGTGKTDFAKTTARYLRIPLRSLVLSSMTDKELVREWSNLPVPCVVLFDDFDTTFHKRENVTTHKSLSFDTVLSLLCGVNSIDGVFTFLTTNKIELIDEALGVSINADGLSTRPGRIDRIIYMGNATRDVRERQIKHILRDWPEIWEDTLDETEDMTIAQVVEVCRQKAFDFKDALDKGSEAEAQTPYTLHCVKGTIAA